MKLNFRPKAAFASQKAFNYLADNHPNDISKIVVIRHNAIGIFFDIAPFKYWPNEKKHDCVFNKNYQQPAVNDVFSSAVNMMEYLQ